MTANRRQFTFGGLMVLLAGKAAASEGAIAELPSLTARYRVKKNKDTLDVDLELLNGGEAVDVLVAWGKNPGPQVQVFAQIAGQELELARQIQPDRREMMSRMGPRPRYVALAAKGTLEVGTYTFGWPEGAEDQVRIEASVDTEGGTIALVTQVVSCTRTAT